MLRCCTTNGKVGETEPVQPIHEDYAIGGKLENEAENTERIKSYTHDGFHELQKDKHDKNKRNRTSKGDQFFGAPHPTIETIGKVGRRDAPGVGPGVKDHSHDFRIHYFYPNLVRSFTAESRISAWKIAKHRPAHRLTKS